MDVWRLDCSPHYLVCWPVCQKSAVPSGKDEEAVASIRWDGKKLNFVNESSSWVDFFGVV